STEVLRKRLQIQRHLNRPAATTLASRGLQIVTARYSVAGDEFRPFTPGIPHVDPAAFQTWWRTAAGRRRRLTAEMFSFGKAAGYWPLREAIAGYLGAARGVRCVPEQVIVTAGTQPALGLVAQLLLDPGDQVWVEDPGYSGPRNVFAA